MGKYRELIAYGAVGLVSVADSIFWFWLFVGPLKLPHLAANALGWFVDVCVVFALNRRFVFRSAGKLPNEAAKFISARLLSGALDTALLFALTDLLALNLTAAKAVDIAVIIAFNYAAAKLCVFNGRRTAAGEIDIERRKRI
jgi:putative flippase GtrA